MLRVCAAAVISALLLSGCSGQRTFNNEDIKSAATEVVSIAAEGELLTAAAAENRVGTNYAKGHPEYLRKQAEDVAKELRQGRPPARSQYQFDRLRRAATQLLETLQLLPTQSGDPRWQQSHSRFEKIHQEAEDIRRIF